MGIEALTHRDDGTAIAVPHSHDDWQQWVSAGRTRNWMLGDPLIDWLHMYGKDRDYIPKHELDSYVEELDFLKFIFERGREFEAGILRLLEQQHEVATVARDYREIASLDKAEETFATMQRGVPVIYQGVLWDAQDLNYGSPDFLVRSDILYELFPNAIAAADASLAAPDLGAGAWHYRVVDTKFATLHFNAAGTQLDNNGSRPAYKAQLYIYNRMLGRMQGFWPQESYLLGRGWQQGTGRDAPRCSNALARLGPVSQKGSVANGVPIADEVERAVAWIRKLRVEGHQWQLLPTPSEPELYPNMSRSDDSEMMLDIGPGEQEPSDDSHGSDGHWVGVKRWLAEELKELTLLPNVGVPRRRTAHNAGVCKWDDPRLTPETVGVTGTQQGPTLQRFLEVNVSRGPTVRPARIEQDREEWHPTPALEFYTDFEFCSELNDDFSKLPEKGGQSLIFMIGCGHIEKGDWRFRLFVTNDLSEDEEIRIIREWVEHMQTVQLRLDPDNHRPRIFHWSHAEVTQLEGAYNSARRRHGDRADWPGDLNWYDFFSKVMRQEPVVVKGTWGFGLKAVAKAMRSHGLIETDWADNPVDGLGAMVGAWRCDAEARKKGTSMADEPLMQMIGEYNEVDCRVMMDIAYYLRENH